MKNEDFAIAFSEKEGEEAVKEVSLKIKRIFPKKINYIILMFTPDYTPAQIIKTINFTLKPKKLFCLQAPWLIFEDKSIPKGIVACCINKENLYSHESFLEEKKSDETEAFFRSAFKNMRKTDYFFLSFISPSINPNSYLNSMKLSLGEAVNSLGIGYMKHFGQHSYQIINDQINQGLTNIALRGLEVDTLQLSGYVPLGRPFKITKVVPSRNLIVEINEQPAVKIYRHYADDKYETFMKKKLFNLYPLGIRKNGSIQLVNIIECLQDGSLVYTGEVKEGSEAHIMFLDTTSLFSEIKNKLFLFQQKGQGLVFMVNSLVRKKILQDLANDEIKFIKQTLGKESKIIGVYSDYCLSADQEKGQIDVETGKLLLTLWN
ncbi:MAG: FIST C-terminal domain-containing protein [Candidatus Omnitrophica bacterium]|nr:FIST C-terminal domain-containing protein [Candidatus Omnitrophota bacterium]